MFRTCLFVTFIVTAALSVGAQEQSVKPGINDSFKNPDVEKFAKTFEGESREVSINRDKVVKACELKEGMVVADIGAGTGLYTRLFAKEVGPDGQIFAVDIAPKFLEHIQKTCRDANLNNVTPVLCNFDSADLPPKSVDVAFLCDAYHHLEFPEKTLRSIHRALKPGGRLIVIDFQRIPGKSSDFSLNHVRAGQEVVEKEIEDAGFHKLKGESEILKENYFVFFEKGRKAGPEMLFPVIEGYGGVVRFADSAEKPIKGSKVVFDVTAIAKETGKPVPGLERAALLLNLAGLSGLKPSDLDIVVVLHGDATYSALTDAAFKTARDRQHDSSALIDQLLKAGVKVQVCGQALARRALDPTTVRPGVAIAASALTSTMNHQAKGYSYIPAH